MKIFRIMAAAGLAGAVIFTAAGCANYNRTGSGLPEKESETAVSETAEETVTKAPQSAHDVSVEDLSKTTYTDDYNNTYTSVYPIAISAYCPPTDMPESNTEMTYSIKHILCLRFIYLNLSEPSRRPMFRWMYLQS